MKKFIVTLFIFFAIVSKANCQELIDGIMLINSNNLNKACEFFENYTNNKPNDADGHWWLGLCYKKQGKEELSEYHLKRAFELSQTIDDIELSEPVGFDNQGDYLDIAQMYLESGDIDKAHTYCDMTLKLNPENAQGYVLRSKIYLAQQDRDNAKLAAIRAIQMDNSLLNEQIAKDFDIKEVPPFDFEYHNSKGVEYYYKGELENSVKCFKKSLELNFRNPVALNNLAQSYIKLQDLDKAEATLKKAQMLNQKYVETYLNLAKCKELKILNNNLSAFSKKRLEREVENYLKKAKSVNPNDKRVYLELGNYYLKEKNYPEAIDNFNTALVYDEKYYEAYIGLAICYIETNNYQKALLAIRNAGALNSKSDEISYYLAKMCIVENKLDEAQEYLKDAIGKGENPKYYIESGKIYYYKDDLKNAKECFRRAQELDFRNENAAVIYNFQGLCHYKEKDLKNAILNLKKAVDLEGDNLIYLYNLSLAYKSANQKDLYQKTCSKIFSKSPKTPQDFIDLSTIYYDNNQIDVAGATLDEGIKKFPNEKVIYLAKLKLLKTIGNKQGEEALKQTINTIFKN